MAVNAGSLSVPPAFNRTILELKVNDVYKQKVGALTFNRTILELKGGLCKDLNLQEKTFNRTILELKV